MPSICSEGPLWAIDDGLRVVLTQCECYAETVGRVTDVLGRIQPGATGAVENTRLRLTDTCRAEYASFLTTAA